MASKIGSKQAIFAITLLVLWSLSLIVSTAFAASGGRMGGDSFSKSKRSSSSSSSSFSSSYRSNYHHHHHYHHNRDRGYRYRSLYYQKSKGSESYGFFTWVPVIMICGVLGVIFWLAYLEAKQKESSVIMVQVGLTGKGRSLQKELNEIAKTTDTSSSDGWKFILTDAASALLRHRQYFISGYSSVKNYWSAESLETNFRQLVMEEREKTDMETLVNVNNVRMARAVVPKTRKLGEDYIVVTVLVAAKGLYELPAIRSIDDLKKVLRSLNFTSEKLQAVEVLWTPQDETESLSEEELLEDYPLLRPI